MQRGSEIPVLSPVTGSPGRVHVVGLGGTGVRGIVPLLLARGAIVSGSDKDDSPVLAQFRSAGIECWVGHSDAHLDPQTDMLLISAAVGRDNPEVRAAEERSIRVVKYAQCLGLLMGEKDGIAIAGTHGKTTTSAMTCFVLRAVGLDPSFVIGGDQPDLGGGSQSGEGRFFVAEACEFDRSFLNLRPKAAVVTNIEADHLDYFESLREIQDSFREFTDLLPEDGFLVYNKDCTNSQFLPLSCKARTESFGDRPRRSDWWAEDIEFDGPGTRFTLCAATGERVAMRLRVPGIHNVRNAMACAAVCRWAGVPLDQVAAALEQFRSVRRRFDVLLSEPCTVIDDYAHHPTEVEAVLDSARHSFPGQRLVCVFQPHQYSRLRIMLDQFADALRSADDVIVTRTYRARDTDADVASVKATSLVDAIRMRKTHALYADGFDRALGQLEGMVQPGTVVLFLGAGDITLLASEFVQTISSGTAAVRGCAAS